MARSAFERTIQLQLDKFGPEAAKRRHIEIARKGFAAFMARQQVKPEYTIEVDGRPASSEEAVKPYGLIVYRFHRLGEAVKFALDFLIAYVRRFYGGKYADNFFVGVNGKFIDAANFNQSHVPPKAEINIGNKLPFNRKLDVQMVGNVPLSFKIPPHLYDVAAVAIKRRYGKIVTVERTYNLRFPGKYILRREQFYGAGKRQGRPRMRMGKPVESPGLVIMSRV